MKKALVFGATGQDGSYLADLLLEKGYEVVGVSRRASTDNTQRIKHIADHPNFSFVEGDITDGFCVQTIVDNAKPDEVYNLAAQSHVGTSFSQPSLTWDITGKGCLNILEAIRCLNIDAKFYQASSSEMFGDAYDIDGENKYQNEDTTLQPQSPYAVAKLAAHHAVNVYRKSYGIFACSGILFNHESERRGTSFVTRKITHYIGELKAHMAACEDAEVDYDTMVSTAPKLSLGNLEARRDWGHARDYVRAMWEMLQQPSPDDYVVCTGETHSVQEFLDEAFLVAGIEDYSPFVSIDPDLFRPAEVPYLKGSYDKAKRKLGWEPEISFNELVALMVNHDISSRCKREQSRSTNVKA